MTLVWSSRNLVARSSRPDWIDSSRAPAPETNSAAAGNSFSFGPRSRRLTATEPFSRSRGPISTRTGTPFLIHSQFFVPPPASRRSVSTRTGSPKAVCPRNCTASFSAASSTATRDSSLVRTGRMTICEGATRGGKTSPSSSECAMISVPMSRVLTPQLVVQASWRLPSRAANSMPEAREKFCPRKCEVPAWMALRSCTMASMQRVLTAPGKRSLSDFSPVKTGSARCSRANFS